MILKNAASGSSKYFCTIFPISTGSNGLDALKFCEDVADAPALRDFSVIIIMITKERQHHRRR